MNSMSLSTGGRGVSDRWSRGISGVVSKVRRLTIAAGVAGAMSLSAGAMAQDLLTEDGVIAGSMQIDFGTRSTLDASGDLKEGSAAIGAKDTYKFTMRVAKTTEFAGEITRKPNLYTKALQRRKQDAELTYSVDMSVVNSKDPKQKRVVGKWVGLVPIDTATGAFDLAGGSAKSDRPLRISVDTVGKAQGFEEKFGGRLMGKAEKKDGLAGYTFKRVVAGKTIEKKLERSDPMRFENITLAAGPSQNYPRTTVLGRLDYDYETGNYITDGIRFKYMLDSKETEDVVTGTIKWVEDADRESNGKGYYEFNLRFNEEKHKSASGEDAAFEKMSDEDAFFAVDNSVPCLTGRISYVDMFKSGSTTPLSSVVTYDLSANKLSKQQVMNFFKLWLLAVGPVNDE